LKKGDDLTEHLSKSILNAGSPDLLLADWRIHHIHISDTKKSPNQKFFDRSDKLAFALITPDAAYLINICDHSQRNVWTDVKLLEIVRNTWPDLLKPFTFKGKLEPAISINEKERQDLRKEGINVPTPIGDVFILSPGGGINAAGFPTAHQTKAIPILNTINLITEFLTGYPEVWNQVESDLGISHDRQSILRLIWDNGSISFREQSSGKVLGFDMAIVQKAVAALMRQRIRLSSPLS
jgi:hypothetical protein